MKSHEVIKESCQKRGIKKVASDVGISTSLLYKWSQPPEASGSGSKNPLDRMINLMQAANDPQMISWICEQAGGYFVRNPNDKEEGDYEVMPATNEIVSQFSALLSEISKAAQDNAIADNESERIRKVWNALKSFTEGFVKCCEEGNFNKMLESK